MSQTYTVYGQDLNSSMLKHGEYTPDLKQLKITFHNGVDYVYTGIEESIAHEFFNAESHGKYFNENIKNKYDFSKI
jgi:hypothetical protein